LKPDRGKFAVRNFREGDGNGKMERLPGHEVGNNGYRQDNPGLYRAISLLDHTREDRILNYH